MIGKYLYRVLSATLALLCCLPAAQAEAPCPPMPATPDQIGAWGPILTIADSEPDQRFTHGVMS